MLHKVIIRCKMEEDPVEMQKGAEVKEGREGVYMRGRQKTECIAGGGGQRQRSTEEKQPPPPPLFLSAAAFPALATMSCANLLLLPHHCTHTHTRGRKSKKEGRDEGKHTHTHTHLAATNRLRNEQKRGLIILNLSGEENISAVD